MDSFSVPHFLKFAISVKIANCQYACFVVSLSQQLVPEKHKFSGINQKPERRRPFGTGLVRHCPQGLFSPFFTFLLAIYFSARLDFSSSPLSAPGSPRMPFAMMPLFVILFEYLTEALITFWHIRHFCRNFPFSPKICHFLITAIYQNFPLCHLI